MNTIDHVKILVSADIPVMLWGPPGVGKTAVLTELADQEGALLETLVGSHMDPTDVDGIMIPDADANVQVSSPPWARRMSVALKRGVAAWLFLDEMTCTPPSVQAALLKLVHERRAGGIDLTGCRIVAAGNPVETAASANTLRPAMSSRWAHLDWHLKPETWISGTLRNWGRRRDTVYAMAAARVASFISKNPGALLSVRQADKGRSWPCPRSWSFAVEALTAAGAADHRQAAHLIAACVGDAAASEWAAWDQARDLPDPEAILDGRERWPERGDQVLSCSLAVVAAAASEHPRRTERLSLAADKLVELRTDQQVAPAQALLDACGGDVPDALVGLAAEIRKARVRLA